MPSRKYFLEDVKEWVEYYNQVYSLKLTSEYFGISRVVMMRNLNKYKEETGFMTLKEQQNILLENEKKMCSPFVGCGVVKDTKEFNKSLDGLFGLNTVCKDCDHKRGKEYRKRPEVKEKRIQYLKDNKEMISKIKYDWYINNVDNVKNRINRWKKSNPDRLAEYRIRRRDRENNLDSEYTKEDYQITLMAFDYKCFNCDSKKDLCVDHHYPLSLGYGLALKNAVVLCRKCNIKKSNHLPEDFYTEEKLSKVGSILDEL